MRNTIFAYMTLFLIGFIVLYMMYINPSSIEHTPKVVSHKAVPLKKEKVKPKSYLDKYVILETTFDTDSEGTDMVLVSYAKAHCTTFDEYNKVVKSFKKYEVAFFGGDYVILPVTLEDGYIKQYAKKHSKSRQMYEIILKSFRIYWVNKPCVSTGEYCGF
jgi:hypothetical protein